MLYECLSRYGDVYQLRNRLNVESVSKKLKHYSNDWVQYNPRKDIPRWGLSITSLDGGLSGIPDLDSVKEFNNKHNLNLVESDFNEPTELYPLVSDALEPYSEFLGRTHFIRMSRKGCFPPHRDQYTRVMESFRLFIPISGCNPPNNYFILDDKIINFEHGTPYFINTCKEHTLFTVGLQDSLFVVANVRLCEESVDAVLSNLMIS